MMYRFLLSRSTTREQSTENRKQAPNRRFPSILYSLFPIPSLAFSLFRAFAIGLAITSAASATVLTATMKTPHFDVRYDPEGPILAQTTADTAEDELARISRALGYRIEPNRPIPLWVYRRHQAFIDEVGLRDEFTVGVARSGDNQICIDASGAFVTMRQVLAHELTHAVIFRVLGDRAGKLPLWVNEGLAKYESEKYYGSDDDLLAEAASANSLIPLTDLRRTFPKQKSSLAYAEAASAVRYLIKRRGPEAPRMLLAELAESGSFEQAFEKAAGQSESAFAADWNARISKRFMVLRIWRFTAAFGGAAMAILAVVAFVIRRRRMARAARQWEWEEFEESMERQLREWPHR